MNPFDYNFKPTERQIGAMNQTRSAFSALATMILEVAPPSRERALAITALEESAMWANKAISHAVDVVPSETRQPHITVEEGENSTQVTCQDCHESINVPSGIAGYDAEYRFGFDHRDGNCLNQSHER